jgi:hypothetical protein
MAIFRPPFPGFVGNRQPYAPPASKGLTPAGIAQSASATIAATTTVAATPTHGPNATANISPAVTLATTPVVLAAGATSIPTAATVATAPVVLAAAAASITTAATVAATPTVPAVSGASIASISSATATAQVLAAAELNVGMWAPTANIQITNSGATISLIAFNSVSVFPAYGASTISQNSYWELTVNPNEAGTFSVGLARRVRLVGRWIREPCRARRMGNLPVWLVNAPVLCL